MILKTIGTSLLDQDDAVDAVTDAFVAYLTKPTAYVHQGEASLFTYLLRIAQRRALDCIRQKRRYKKIFSEPVEDSTLEPIDDKELDRADTELDAITILTRFGSELAKDEIEREILRLHLAGEKDTHAYATVLKLTDRPFEEQCQAVKRYRDRLERRLIRLGEKL